MIRVAYQMEFLSTMLAKGKLEVFAVAFGAEAIRFQKHSRFIFDRGAEFRGERVSNQ